MPLDDVAEPLHPEHLEMEIADPKSENSSKRIQNI